MVKRVNPVPSVPATPAKQNPNPTDNTSKKPVEQGFQSILDKHTKDKPDNFKKGGMASKRADGCCIKGKTKGRMV
jgi:hypothetical protein